MTDHHAILPTKTLEDADLAGLPSGELAVLDLIMARLICAVGDPCRYLETSVTLDCAGHEFKAKGKTVIDLGWRAFANTPADEQDGDDAQALPDLAEAVSLPLVKVELKEGKTSPPKRFTEDTLLAHMESAGADEMPEEVERKGIGTPPPAPGSSKSWCKRALWSAKARKRQRCWFPRTRAAH